LATLRQLPNLVDLLRPRALANGEPRPTVWWLVREQEDDSSPTLVVGIRETVGFLKWYSDPSRSQVPVGTEYRGGGEEYFHSGYSHGGGDPGEEIPVEQVYAAAAQFVATGLRPTIIQWMNDVDVPNYVVPASLDDDPVYLAMKAVDGE
jgi:hypothetical protein